MLVTAAAASGPSDGTWRSGNPRKAGVGRDAELCRRSMRLALAQASQARGRIGHRVRMRSGPVADDNDAHGDAVVSRRRDQPAASQALVIGVRRDDNQAADGELPERQQRHVPHRRARIRRAHAHDHRSAAGVSRPST